MSPSSASLTAILLTERSVPSDAPPLSASEFWPLVRYVDIERLVEGGMREPLDLGRSRIIDQERLDALLARSTAVAFELDRLAQTGIRVFSALDDPYPGRLRDRLGDAAPPLLYVAGDAGLFDRDALAIVGSRGVSEVGAEVARHAAQQAVTHGYAVVSGGARGVDQLAMSAAWNAGGEVIGFLSEGLGRSLRTRENRAAVLEGRALLCSPYKPTAGFTAGNAMARNKLIYAQSTVTFVVATDEGSGGTWAGATEALKKELAPVAVWMGAGTGPGNAALVDLGAAPVEDLDQLVALLAAPESVRSADGTSAQPVTVTQLGLDLTE